MAIVATSAILLLRFTIPRHKRFWLHDSCCCSHFGWSSERFLKEVYKPSFDSLNRRQRFPLSTFPIFDFSERSFLFKRDDDVIYVGFKCNTQCSERVKDLYLPLVISTVTNSDLEAAKYPPFRLNYIPEVTFSTINTKPTRQEHYTITLVIAKEQACPVPIPGNKN